MRAYNRAERTGEHIDMRSLLVLLTALLLCARLSRQQDIPYPLAPVTMQYARPTEYPCMDDWNKVCEKDSDCCSGVCMTFFCKVVGIEVTNPPKRKRPKITINIS